MMPQPLFVKFRSDSDFYVFDSNTNEILQVSSLVYTIIDDFMVIGDDEIVQKFSDRYDGDHIREAISALRQIIQKRFLQISYSENSFGSRCLCCNKKPYTFHEFLNNFSAMLIIEITQKCNLDCQYCIYGKYYQRHPHRVSDSISIEIAERAIKSHWDKPQSGGTITFYGGEPLLEFDLLRHLVLYAEHYSRKIGKNRPVFSLTTNGTLIK